MAQKYGLLTYNYSKEYLYVNIGDYIQSLAAKQFISDNENIIYVNRESLSDYNGDPVKVIFNGWFIHNPKKWPPSSKITPLFVAFHINESVKNELLNSSSIEYLKRHAPIGCRDVHTVNLLQEKGIDSYFSSCLTLTLNRTYATTNPLRQEIIFTEFDFNFYSKNRICKRLPQLLFRLITNYQLIKKIAYNFHDNTKMRTLINAAYFVSIYSKLFSLSILKEATYIDHYVHISKFETDEDRFNLAKHLLSKYANAKLIITSKIHCALPSLSFNTPVIYIEDSEDLPSNLCRKTGLLELFDDVYYFNKGKLTKRLKKATKSYSEYAKNLAIVCEKFMSD